MESHVQANKAEGWRGVKNWQRYKVKVLLEFVPKDLHRLIFSKCLILKTNFLLCMEIILALTFCSGTFYIQLPGNASNTKLTVVRTVKIFM